MSSYRRYLYHQYPLPRTDQLAWFQSLSIDSLRQVDHQNQLSPSIIYSDIQLVGYYAKYIPCIQEIYLSGDSTWSYSSQTIGLCIITSSQKIRTVYAMSLLLLQWLRWRQPHHHYEIHAIIDHNNMSVYPLSYKPIDPYLVYWIAHLTLIYIDYNTDSANIYSHNHRIGNFLPAYQFESINTDNGCSLTVGSHSIKRILNRIMSHQLRNMVEKILHTLIHMILIYLHRKSPHDMPLITQYIIAYRPGQRFEDHLIYKHHTNPHI